MTCPLPDDADVARAEAEAEAAQPGEAEAEARAEQAEELGEVVAGAVAAAVAEAAAAEAAPTAADGARAAAAQRAGASGGGQGAKAAAAELAEAAARASRFAVELKLSLDRRDEALQALPDDVRYGTAGWRGRYYASKLGIGEDEPGRLREVVQAYVEGLIWVLRYYYQGVQSCARITLLPPSLPPACVCAHPPPPPRFHPPPLPPGAALRLALASCTRGGAATAYARIHPPPLPGARAHRLPPDQPRPTPAGRAPLAAGAGGAGSTRTTMRRARPT